MPFQGFVLQPLELQVAGVKYFVYITHHINLRIRIERNMLCSSRVLWVEEIPVLKVSESDAHIDVVLLF